MSGRDPGFEFGGTGPGGPPRRHPPELLEHEGDVDLGAELYDFEAAADLPKYCIRVRELDPEERARIRDGKPRFLGIPIRILRSGGLVEALPAQVKDLRQRIREKLDEGEGSKAAQVRGYVREALRNRGTSEAETDGPIAAEGDGPIDAG